MAPNDTLVHSTVSGGYSADRNKQVVDPETGYHARIDSIT